MSEPPSQTKTGGGTSYIFVNRFFHPDISATSQILSDLAFYLAEQGHDVHVVCSRQLYQDPKARLMRRESVRGVTVHRIWSTRFGRYNLFGRMLDTVTFLAAALAWLLFRATRTDLVIAKTDPPMLGVVVSAAKLVRRFRLVNWLQDLFPEIAEVMAQGRAKRAILAPFWWLLRVARNFSLRHANMNIAIGEGMATRLEAMGVAPAQITIAYNWSPGETVVPVDKATNPLLAEWGLQGKFVVMYSGNMGRVHEFNTLLSAAAALKHDTTISFLFVGDGPTRPWLATQVSLHHLPNVAFFPYQDSSSLARSLSAADIHIVSLRSEMDGLVVPSKLYGILAAARPAIFIGSATHPIGTLLEDSNAGKRIIAGDSQALVAAILDYRNNPILAASHGETGLRLYQTSFSRARALNAHQRLLASCRPASRRNPPRG